MHLDQNQQYCKQPIYKTIIKKIFATDYRITAETTDISIHFSWAIHLLQLVNKPSLCVGDSKLDRGIQFHIQVKQEF